MQFPHAPSSDESMPRHFPSALGYLLLSGTLHAGMPAPLPTPFTEDAFPQFGGLSPWVDVRLQAISLFVMAILCSAAVVRWLWNLMCVDWPALRPLTFRRAIVAVVLWGLVFIVVLTMISGARELMTPGAWIKRGWTYQPVESPAIADGHHRPMREEALKALRVELLKYAALHEGRFPETTEDLPVDWRIPAHPGLEFLYRGGQRVAEAGRILVFEPELGDDDRLILLTNGMIGMLATAELEATLHPQEARDDNK
jgi:hypothetical protein